MKDVRQSNIELLRILAMFMVLISHYFPLRNLGNNFTNGEGYSMFTYELNSLCIVCVNVFIIISGYFGIKWKWKSFFNYIFQVFFWVIISYVIAILFKWEEFDTGVLFYKIKSFLSYNYFILSYLGLCLFAPILNAFIDSSNEKQFRYFIIAFYLFSTIFGWILQVSPEIKEGCTYVSFMGLYLIGAYIRKNDIRLFNFSRWIDLSIYIILGFFLVLITVIAKHYGINSSPYGYLNPIVILQSIYLFLFFSKLSIQSNVINWIASSSFAVFLFHYNPSIFPIYKKICIGIIKDYTFHFPVIVFFLIFVFIISILIDKIRIYIFNILLRMKR